MQDYFWLSLYLNSLLPWAISSGIFCLFACAFIIINLFIGNFSCNFFFCSICSLYLWFRVFLFIFNLFLVRVTLCRFNYLCQTWQYFMIITLLFFLEIIHGNSHSSNLNWLTNVLITYSLLFFFFILHCITLFWLVSVYIFVLFSITASCDCIVYPPSCMVCHFLKFHKVELLTCSLLKIYISQMVANYKFWSWQLLIWPQCLLLLSAVWHF